MDGPSDFLDKLLGPYHEPDDRDRAIFGTRYSPPENFEPGKWFTVARYDKTGGDGQPCEIAEMRTPARFFQLLALPSQDSIGNPLAGFKLSTGSGDEMGRLMARLADAVADGMVHCVAYDLRG